MGVNLYQEHLYVLLEDEEYQKIMNGVNLSLHVNNDVVKISHLSGGWGKVLEDFRDPKNSIGLLKKFQKRHALLLMDFDYEFNSRLEEFRQLVPDELKNRVFILGIDNKESEDLAKYFKCNSEEVGKKLIENCPNGDLLHWQNIHLRCNLSEIERMREAGIFAWLFLEKLKR